MKQTKINIAVSLYVVLIFQRSKGEGRSRWNRYRKSGSIDEAKTEPKRRLPQGPLP